MKQTNNSVSKKSHLYLG